jgi:hypothetical protein
MSILALDVVPSVQTRDTLERLLPTPRRREVDHVDLAAAPGHVWRVVRHTDLARGPLIRALIGLPGLPGRSEDRDGNTRLCIDDFRSTPERPGFLLLADEPPQRFTVGAIARVHAFQLSFTHIANAAAFEDFRDPGFVKVAWSVDVLPYGAGHSRLQFELRIDATDATTWRGAHWYFALIGPGMHFVRRSVLSLLAVEFGWPRPNYRLGRSERG